MGTSHQPVARPVIDGGPVEIARAFFSLPESAAYAVGGGMAAIAYGVIARPTEDIDLFRDRRRAGVGPQEAADAFADAARGRGWLVRWARRFPEYARIEIVTPQVGLLVDIAFETFDLPVQMTVLGPTVAEQDVAVGKVLALFDRAEARDFADVFEFASRFDRDELLEIAMDRDGGLGRADLAERIRRVTEVLGPAHFPEMLRGRFDEMQTFYQAWRSELLRAGR